MYIVLLTHLVINTASVSVSFLFFTVVSTGRRRDCHLYHKLQCVGDRKMLDHCCVGGWPYPDPGPAFELRSHRSVTANGNGVI